MIKKLIAPIQAWLLSQNRCVGCGNPLSQAIRKKVKGNITAACKCGRVFIFDESKNKYRRALFSEI